MTSPTTDSGVWPAQVAGPVREHAYVPPSGATQLLLVRHGETVAAQPDVPFPMLNGHGDPPLGVEGRRQAEMLADRLATEPLEAIYVSSLRRTLETAAPLVERTGIAPVVEPELREAHLGEWEGHTWRMRIAERHPLAVQMIEQQRWDLIPGSEHLDGFARRVVGALNRIAHRHRGGRVAVFTHGGVIGQAIAHACDASPYPFNAADNASISQLVITPDRWRVKRFNDGGHLMPLVSVR